MAAILVEFNISDKIRYFILENVLNNDTCMEALGEELRFNWKERRLWCAGHIINLMAYLILYGKDIKALKDKLEKAKDKIKQLKL